MILHLLYSVIIVLFLICIIVIIITFDSLQAVLLLVTAVYPHAKEIDITMEKWTHSDRDANDMIWGWDNKKGRIFVKKGNF